MNTILVPTDFSKNAKNALTYAVAIAKKEKSKIILLHAYNITYLSPDVPLEYLSEQLASTQLESAKILNVLCEKVKSEDKVNCEFINQEGALIDVILDSIKHKKIDLVVMGTKGASGMKEVFIGSNTAQVMGKALCPVLAVPEKAEFEGIKKIVYATDYHKSDLEALKELSVMAHVFKAKIKVLHISEIHEEHAGEEQKMKQFSEQALAYIDAKDITFQLLYASNIEKKLEKYVVDEQVNLLVMSTRYRNFIEGIFGKSITQKLVYHTKVPLMAFHYKS